MGDADGRAEAMEGLRKLNAKHPGLRISMDTIDRSMAAHMKQTQKMYHGIALSTGMRAELLRDAAELE
jgi:molecular chaperone DnaK (HSP70)